MEIRMWSKEDNGTVRVNPNLDHQHNSVTHVHCASQWRVETRFKANFRPKCA